MWNPKAPLPEPGPCPLSIEQLEAGLRVLADRSIDPGAFWDEHIDAFRQSVLLAIRETSDELLSPTIPDRWRAELEGQLHVLVQYVGLADRYIAWRRGTRAPRAVEISAAELSPQ